MRNYIILNNKSSNDINGLIIQELAPISKPQQRTQVEMIDGRDGDIVTPLGYAAYNKKIKIGLYGDFDINEIIAYFATKGTAIFSNEPDKYYNYQILDQIDYERLVRFRVATVTMHVQPFKYSATEGTLTIDASDTVSGEGSEIALDNTAEAPFTTLRHKGNAIQTTYEGKNLLYNELLPKTQAGVALGHDNGVFSLNGTAGIASNAYIITNSTSIVHLEAGESLTLYIERVSGTSQVYFTGYFKPDDASATDSDWGVTLPENQNSIKRVKIASKAGSLDSIQFFLRSGVAYDSQVKILVQKGNAAEPSWEPYVGGKASPNPDYPQDIKLLTGDSTIAIDDGGDNSQEYVIPFGDTYLAAIGDYADEPVKVGDKWYIRRAIGKVVWNGTESWNGGNKQGGYYSFFRVDPSIKLNTANEVLTLSDHFTSYGTPSDIINSATIGLTTRPSTSGQGFYVRSNLTSSTGWNTWLSTHPTTVYYALATPTDEEITDQALIDALDDFYEQAHGYKGRTHITASAQGDQAIRPHAQLSRFTAKAI